MMEAFRTKKVTEPGPPKLKLSAITYYSPR